VVTLNLSHDKEENQEINKEQGKVQS